MTTINNDHPEQTDILNKFEFPSLSVESPMALELAKLPPLPPIINYYDRTFANTHRRQA